MKNLGQLCPNRVIGRQTIVEMGQEKQLLYKNDILGFYKRRVACVHQKL